MRGGFLHRFGVGARIPLAGFKLLRNDFRLWSLAIVPILVMVILCTTGVWALLVYLPTAITSILPTLTGLAKSLVYWVSLLLGLGVGFVATGFLSIFLTKILAIPFYTLMAERATLRLSGQAPQPTNLSTWVVDNVKMLRVSFLKGFIFFFLGIFLFFVSLIPVVNIIALIGGLILISFDCMDYVLEAKRLSFSARVIYAKKLIPEVIGMAAILGLFLAIPGISFVLIPSAIVGSAEMLNGVVYDDT